MEKQDDFKKDEHSRLLYKISKFEMELDTFYITKDSINKCSALIAQNKIIAKLHVS